MESKRAASALVIALGLTAVAWGDEFGRLEGALLFDLPRRADAHHHSSLTLAALEALPGILPGENAALVLVQTDQGNLAKMLVSGGLRKLKPSEREGPLVPVLILERYETIDSGDHVSITARGKELMLFDGFQFDLDTGQVVPAGLGGDILFATNAPEGPRMIAVGQNKLTTLEKRLSAVAASAGRPSSGRVIRAGDYSGRYHLIANGQWSGVLDLSVDADAAVTGRFRSDLNGAVHAVTGKVSVDSRPKIEFEIQFPQARQSYDGMLWTEGKNAFAGTLSMLDRPYSFIAIREGAVLSADGIELGLSGPSPETARRIIISLDSTAEHVTLDGKPCSLTELERALKGCIKSEPAIEVLLRVPDAVPLVRIRQVVELIQTTGVKSIRLAVLAGKADPN